MENMEIIDETLSKLVDANIERVDFNDPMSIMNYGSALLNEMGNLMQSVASMFKEDENQEAIGDIGEKIRSLGTFSDSLEKVNNLSNKANSKKVVGLITSAVDKLPFIKIKVKANPTYSSEYEDYCTKVEEVAKIIESQKNSTLVDLEISKSFINKLEPYIKLLEAVIAVGFQDKQKFEEETLEPLRIDYETTNDEITKKQFAVANQKLELFKEKLVRLQETLNLAKVTLAENQLGQTPNMQLVMMYESYIQNTVPALKIQAASIVGTTRQKKRIDNQQLLVEVTNEAFLKNSEQITRNIGEVNKIAAGGNIKVSTLQELQKNIGEAVELIQKGYSQRLEERNKNVGLLNDISNSLNRYQDTVANMISSNVFGANDTLETSTDNALIEAKGSYVKGLKNVGQ